MAEKLSLKAFAKASSILWGGGVFLVGAINLVRPGYGGMFLNVLSSVYPGYNGEASMASVLVLTLYALLDGAIAGLLFAWIYNSCLRCCSKK